MKINEGSSDWDPTSVKKGLKSAVKMKTREGTGWASRLNRGWLIGMESTLQCECCAFREASRSALESDNAPFLALLG